MRWQELRETDPERARWLKGTRFALRRRADHQRPGDRSILDELARTNTDIYLGWLLLDQLRAVYEVGNPTKATRLLDEWVFAACTSGLDPMIRVAITIDRYAKQVVTAIVLGLSNARLEGMNSTVRLISHRARGFRRLESLLAMITLVCGRIPAQLPT